LALADLDAIGRDARLSPTQRSFIADLSRLIHSTKAPALNEETILPTIAGKPTPTVTIALPHRVNARQRVEIFVEPEAIVFSYDGDHLHFGYGEPDPPIEEALEFARDLLEGRIELELRGWLLGAGVTTYRRNPDGTREELQSGGYLGWIGVPFQRTTRVISFE
jgi:hypothetical protein